MAAVKIVKIPSGASVDTFECLNVIDDRLLEDVDPRKLSFLKHQAEKKTLQKSKKRRHYHGDSLPDRQHGLSFVNPTSESPTAWAIKHLIPPGPMSVSDLQDVERQIKRKQTMTNQLRRRNIPHADTSSSNRNSAMTNSSYRSFPGEENDQAPCGCVIM